VLFLKVGVYYGFLKRKDLKDGIKSLFMANPRWGDYFTFEKENSSSLDSDTRIVLDKIRVTCKRYGDVVNLSEINEVGYRGKSTLARIKKDLAPLIEQGFLVADRKGYLFTDKGRGAIPTFGIDKSVRFEVKRPGRRVTMGKTNKLTRIASGTSNSNK